MPVANHSTPTDKKVPQDSDSPVDSTVEASTDGEATELKIQGDGGRTEVRFVCGQVEIDCYSEEPDYCQTVKPVGKVPWTDGLGELIKALIDGGVERGAAEQLAEDTESAVIGGIDFEIEIPLYNINDSENKKRKKLHVTKAEVQIGGDGRFTWTLKCGEDVKKFNYTSPQLSNPRKLMDDVLATFVTPVYPIKPDKWHNIVRLVSEITTIEEDEGIDKPTIIRESLFYYMYCQNRARKDMLHLGGWDTDGNGNIKTSTETISTFLVNYKDVTHQDLADYLGDAKVGKVKIQKYANENGERKSFRVWTLDNEYIGLNTDEPIDEVEL